MSISVKNYNYFAAELLNAQRFAYDSAKGTSLK